MAPGKLNIIPRTLRKKNMQYRRANTKGGTYFFAVNLAERKKKTLLEYVQILREEVSKVKVRHPFVINAMVVLPDHLHAMWTLPQNDADYSTRWMLIKAGFSRRIIRGERINASRIKKGERGIWQRRYWEHFIRDERDYKMHVDYIHYNPVKHGYVGKSVDWPNSSIHRYIAAGMIDRDWGGNCVDQSNGYGER